jgi:hypothetical protein
VADTQWSPGPLEIDGLDSLWKLREFASFNGNYLDLIGYKKIINNWRTILTV